MKIVHPHYSSKDNRIIRVYQKRSGVEFCNYLFVYKSIILNISTIEFVMLIRRK